MGLDADSLINDIEAMFRDAGLPRNKTAKIISDCFKYIRKDQAMPFTLLQAIGLARELIEPIEKDYHMSCCDQIAKITGEIMGIATELSNEPEGSRTAQMLIHTVQLLTTQHYAVHQMDIIATKHGMYILGD